MDILSRELATLRIRNTIHCPTQVRVPFAVSFGCKGGSPYYIITEGECWLTMGSADPRGRECVHLRAGDLAILPRDIPHCLHDNQGTPPVPLMQLLESHTPDADGIWRFGAYEGRTGSTTTLVGGIFNFDNAATSPLMHSLPPLIHVRAPLPGMERGGVPLLAIVVSCIRDEMRHGLPGSESIIARLSDVLFIQALRATVDAGNGAGWLQALSDENLRPVLSMVHENPSHPWTVADMASHAAMSRSGFAARFTEMIGEPPLRYVTRLRMHRAAELLAAGSRASVAHVAEQVGYETEASFSKAFKQWLGTSPAAFRRESLPPPPATSGFMPLPHLMRLAQESAATFSKV